MDTEVSVVTVTPEMAMEWTARNTYEHQRAVAPLHVKFLAEEMERGAFKQDTVIEFCRLNGSDLLTDGQHRLSAIVASGKQQRFVIVRRLLKNEDEVALDYTKTDKGKRRTTADDYKVLLLEEELGLTATQVNKLGGAVVLLNGRFANHFPRTMHTDERLKLMREYNDAYGAFLEISAGCSRDMYVRLARAATLAVALVTLRYSVLVYKNQVEEFWKGTIYDDGLRAFDPRKAANRHLLDTGMVGGAQGGSRKISTAAYSSRYLANCFNAYVSGKQLSYSKVFDTSKPIEIKGSPFNGK